MEKSNLWVLAIVGVVALVALVMIFSGGATGYAFKMKLPSIKNPIISKKTTVDAVKSSSLISAKKYVCKTFDVPSELASSDATSSPPDSKMSVIEFCQSKGYKYCSQVNQTIYEHYVYAGGSGCTQVDPFIVRNKKKICNPRQKLYTWKACVDGRGHLEEIFIDSVTCCQLPNV